MCCVPNLAPASAGPDVSGGGLGFAASDMGMRFVPPELWVRRRRILPSGTWDSAEFPCRTLVACLMGACVRGGMPCGCVGCTPGVPGVGVWGGGRAFSMAHTLQLRAACRMAVARARGTALRGACKWKCALRGCGACGVRCAVDVQCVVHAVRVLVCGRPTQCVRDGPAQGLRSGCRTAAQGGYEGPHGVVDVRCLIWIRLLPKKAGWADAKKTFVHPKSASNFRPL